MGPMALFPGEVEEPCEALIPNLGASKTTCRARVQAHGPNQLPWDEPAVACVDTLVVTGLRPKFGPQLYSCLHVVMEGIALCVHERHFVIFTTDHSESELSTRCFATRCTLAASGETYWKTAFEPGRQPPLAKSSFKEAAGLFLKSNPATTSIVRPLLKPCHVAWPSPFWCAIDLIRWMSEGLTCEKADLVVLFALGSVPSGRTGRRCNTSVAARFCRCNDG